MLVFYSCILIQVCSNGETEPYLDGKIYKGTLDLRCKIS